MPRISDLLADRFADALPGTVALFARAALAASLLALWSVLFAASSNRDEVVVISAFAIPPALAIAGLVRTVHASRDRWAVPIRRDSADTMLVIAAHAGRGALTLAEAAEALRAVHGLPPVASLQRLLDHLAHLGVCSPEWNEVLECAEWRFAATGSRVMRRAHWSDPA